MLNSIGISELVPCSTRIVTVLFSTEIIVRPDSWISPTERGKVGVCGGNVIIILPLGGMLCSVRI